ncbi:MAG: hypothetical protein ACOYUZ_04075 [Patescibacteria group bacterium]
MIQAMVNGAEDLTGLKFYRKQICRELDAGLLTQDQADDLLNKIEAVRGYAGLEVLLISSIIIRYLLNFSLPWWLKQLANNIAVSIWPIIDRRTSFGHLHSPGILLVRCIPGCTIVATNIAMLRAQPDLHDVALRFCEHAYRSMHLSFLIPVFVRPAMAGIRWLNSLNWPMLQKPT